MSDATLSGLTVTHGSPAVTATLSPAFDSETEEYTASVGNGVAQVTVTATKNDDGAGVVIKLNGVEDPDGMVNLVEGSDLVDGKVVGKNVITIEVTAEDGSSTKTYTVIVTRVEPSPEGIWLERLNAGGTEIDLSLALKTTFNGTVHTERIPVPFLGNAWRHDVRNSVAEITVTAPPKETGFTVAITTISPDGTKPSITHTDRHRRLRGTARRGSQRGADKGDPVRRKPRVHADHRPCQDRQDEHAVLG